MVRAHLHPAPVPHGRSATFRMCQRRVARRTKGSKRRANAVTMLAKAHQHIANQRRDFHHKEGAQAGTPIRHDLSRRPAGPQYGADPSPGQEHQRCRAGARASPSSLSRLQAPGSEWKRSILPTPVRLFGLWGDDRRQGAVIRALASVPSVRNDRSIAITTPRPEHPAAGTRAPVRRGSRTKWAGIRPSDANVARWGERSSPAPFP